MIDLTRKTESVGDSLFAGKVAKPILNVVTACSRPKNLPTMQFYLSRLLPSFEVRWYVVFDTAKHSIPAHVPGAYFVGGHPGKGYGADQRNVALEQIKEGWVWCLDDDNTPHPAFDTALSRAIASGKHKAGVVFGQCYGDVVIREAKTENMRVGEVDMAQFVLHRDYIADVRFPSNGSYEADWQFFSPIWNAHQTEIGMGPPATYYNSLTPRDKEIRGVPKTAYLRRRNAVHWRSYEDLHRDIQRWIPHLPPIRAVAGVPRSGVVAATILAAEMHIPIVPIECLLHDVAPYRPTKSRPLVDRGGPILVLDDAVWTGQTLQEIRPKLSHRSDIIYGAVYSNGDIPAVVDVAGYSFASIQQLFAWNLFCDGNLNHIATDMDGVLCEDWHGPEEGEHAERYKQHIDSGKPLFLPRVPSGVPWRLRAVVTSRLHQHDQATRFWLDRHGVPYKELVMAPYANCEERIRKKGFAERKAEIYRYLSKRGVRWFVESDPSQADTIARITGLPVIDFAGQRGINCVPPEPLFNL